jgi:hypothetical protein
MTIEQRLPVGTVHNPVGTAQWLRFGLPFTKGACMEPAQLSLVDGSGETINSGFRVLTHWHDGSIQWALVDVITGLPGPVYLRTSQPGGKPAAPSGSSTPRNDDSEDRIRNDGKVRLGRGLNAWLTLTIEGRARPLSLVRKHQVRGALCDEFLGVYAADGAPDLELSLRIYEIPTTGHCALKAHVHNRAAGMHPDGCWDLGDPNSAIIENLSLTVVDERASQTSLTLTDQSTQGQKTPKTYSSGQLFQYGSGGEHWDSPVHVDKNGCSTVVERGFKLFDPQRQLLETGLRASPEVRFEDDTDTRSLVPRNFWENFPSSLELKSHEATWRLFPQETELQPGEAKTWVCDIGVSKPQASFSHNAAYIDETKVFLGCKVSVDNELSDLLDTNLSGPESFYEKRERCDEYGWRNFGELYADHEAMNMADNKIFVSHYNNQYDPVWGFALRSLCTGDERWQALTADLAHHVVDIDIYKTNRDKAEYNNGLFWHTDHYLPALTATHRTYSRDHDYAYEGHQGGGGPGGQHCYSSGLALRYLLTGDDTFKQSVIGLCEWIRCFYNGAPTVIARLHRLLTVDLKDGRMTNVGFIEKGYKYPLDRGTGNYLNTLIDTYLMMQDPELLDEMHGVIFETVSPYDDLAARDLTNVEEHWFYIVFLQSLVRYLLLKEQLEQADDQYAYARHTLIHYAEWILEHEKPYLTEPQALEFPTDTWAAQDIRKANVLYYSAYFNPARAQVLNQKAEEFWAYCVDTLADSPERRTTRVQAILAQNLGVREWCLENGVSPYPLPAMETIRIQRVSTWRRFLKDLRRAFRSFSFRNEIEWLKCRLGGR